MTNEIFISHTGDDMLIAYALAASVEEIFDGKVHVMYSNSNKPGESPPVGGDWFEWISKHVRQCDFALLVLTKASVNKSWILWESGLIYGMKKLNGNNEALWPVVYGLKQNEVPKHLWNTQWRDGNNDIRRLLLEILEQYKGKFDAEQLINAERNIEEVAKRYEKRVDFAFNLKSITKLVKEYKAITWDNYPVEEQRTRKKSELAVDLGISAKESNLSRQMLLEQNDQVYLLTLAALVYECPEENDIKLLLKTKGRVTLKHVQYKILESIDLLTHYQHRGYINKEDVSAIEQIITDFKADADNKLSNLINWLKAKLDKIKTYEQPADFTYKLKSIQELVQEYKAITWDNYPVEEQRAMKKNEIAVDLGICAKERNLSRQMLSEETDEVSLLTLAALVYERPEENDIKFLLKTKGRVTLKHVRYKILESIDRLTHYQHRGYIKKEDVPAIEQIITDFEKYADGKLLNLINWFKGRLHKIKFL